YGYSVSAIDNAGNESLPSVPGMVTTPPCPTSTTVPPTTTTSTSTTTTNTPTASGGMAMRACLANDSTATQDDRHDAAGFTPAHPTMAVIEPHWPENPYTPYVGTVDIIGVDRYPCSYVSGCVFSKIDDTLALLDQAGVPHYWAFIQAFADSYYRMPTADEVHE